MCPSPPKTPPWDVLFVRILLYVSHGGSWWFKTEWNRNVSKKSLIWKRRLFAISLPRNDCFVFFTCLLARLLCFLACFLLACFACLLALLAIPHSLTHSLCRLLNDSYLKLVSRKIGWWGNQSQELSRTIKCASKQGSKWSLSFGHHLKQWAG